MHDLATEFILHLLWQTIDQPELLLSLASKHIGLQHSLWDVATDRGNTVNHYVKKKNEKIYDGDI